MYAIKNTRWLTLCLCLAPAFILFMLVLPARADQPTDGIFNPPAGVDAPVNIIGINGAACAYDNFAAAMAAASSGNTLYIAQGTHTGRIGTIGKNLAFNAANATCTASASSGVTIDANDAAANYGGVAYISSGMHVTFTNLVLTDGSAWFGGIVYVMSESHVVLNNTDLSYGTASTLGGGLRIRDGAVVEMINGSEIVENVTTGTGDGGGVSMGGGTLIMRDSSRIGDSSQANTSVDKGGGVFMENGLLQMYDTSRIRSNDAATDGGGVYATNNADIEMYDTSSLGYSSSTADNDAAYGGGIYLDGSGTTLKMYEDSTVRYNDATTQGGGIFATNGANVLIDSASVLNNEAVSFGGGIFIEGGAQATIQNNSTINSNEITGPALSSCCGGIYIYEPGTVMTVTASSVMSNTSSGSYGGIGVDGNATFRLLNGANLSYNQAIGYDGGGLGLELGSVNLNNAVIQHNTAADDGGGIYLENGTILAVDSDIRYNTVNNLGGGIYRSGGALEISANKRPVFISNNSSLANDGGGIYDTSGERLILQATNGYPLYINNNQAEVDGGGISTEMLTQVEGYGWVQVSGNTAGLNGGGIYQGDSTLWMTRTSDTSLPQIWGNTAERNGGGVYAINSQVKLNGAQVGAAGMGNQALLETNGFGGGLYVANSTLELVNTIVQDNISEGQGGGVAADTGSTVTIRSEFPSSTTLAGASSLPATLNSECDPASLPADSYCSEFRGNSAPYGGALTLHNESTGYITHTAFISNTANYGAAIQINDSEVALSDSLVHGNVTAYLNSATIDAYHGSHTSRFDGVHNTIAGNSGGALHYGISTEGQLYNNIIWNNSEESVFDGTVTLDCNDMQETPPAGNISLDPQFITTARGPYHIGANSPAVDACETGNPLDLDNTLRPIGSDYDMGAFESLLVIYLPLIAR